MDKIQIFLKNIGLSEKESELYLTGLKIGSARAAMFSRRTGFTRQHIYDLLKSLEQKGLVSKIGKNYGQRFVMEDPKNIRNFLERKKQKIEKLNLTLEKIMPEFESSCTTKGVIPKIKFFEEIEGIKEIFEDVLNCKSKEQFYIGSIRELLELLGEEYFNNWIERRIKKKIFSRAIRIKEKEIKNKLYTNEKKLLREIRFAPANTNITQTIVMYDNKVAIISSKKELFGFLIESEEYFNTNKILFDLLWNNSS
ncbi:MAG: helix-turn-helix domain-containing protein [Parcubacteria group bacterium]